MWLKVLVKREKKTFIQTFESYTQFNNKKCIIYLEQILLKFISLLSIFIEDDEFQEKASQEVHLENFHSELGVIWKLGREEVWQNSMKSNISPKVWVFAKTFSHPHENVLTHVSLKQKLKRNQKV